MSCIKRLLEDEIMKKAEKYNIDYDDLMDEFIKEFDSNWNEFERIYK